MNRREALSALTGITAAAGVTAETKSIEAEPQPLLAVLTVEEPLPPEVMHNIHQCWERLWKGPPPFPVVILQPGMDLDVIVDPRKQP